MYTPIRGSEHNMSLKNTNRNVPGLLPPHSIKEKKYSGSKTKTTSSERNVAKI